MAKIRKHRRPKSAEGRSGLSKEERKKKLTQGMTIFIAVLMIGSIGGFLYLGGSQQNVVYNGVKFVFEDNLWTLKQKGMSNMKFNVVPQEVEDIPLDNSIISSLDYAQGVLITYDPDSEYAETLAEVQFNLQDFFVNNEEKYAVNTFSKENIYGVPVATCLNATQGISVISLEVTDNINDTKIYKEGECIIISAFSQQGFMAFKDRLIYGMLGVI